MSRPRDRASAAGLLPGMEARVWADGRTVTYRYHPASGKPVSLGTDRAAALQAVVAMLGQAPHHGTMRWLWEQWQKGRRWARLSDGTRADYALAWKEIDKRLGHMQARSVTAPIVARYVHVERAGSPRRATIEKTVLSNLFKHGIMLGVCALNSADGVEPHVSEPSRTMPETAALKAFLGWLDTQTPQRRVIGLAAEFASLAGNRRIEALDLAWTQVDLDEGVIRLKRAKQRRLVIDRVVITPRMRALLDRIKALNRDCLYLFPNKFNNPYSTEGIETMFQRCMLAAVEAKVLTPEQRFNFHALRRYYTTMHRAKYDTRPNLHADERVTARVYDATVEEERKAL
jgi:integrase